MTHDEHVAETMTALTGLGVFKEGEEARTLHAHGCTWRKGTCTCPGGPELTFSDWDELQPQRWLWRTPERFYVNR